jgi:hypothetical protein
VIRQLALVLVNAWRQGRSDCSASGANFGGADLKNS